MENQRQYSHGLLYSVAPENFSTLHLHDEDGMEEFDWEAYKTELEGESPVRLMLNLLKRIAAIFGIGKV